MSHAADLKREYCQAAPEQRLAILRRELSGPIATVQSIATLLKQIDAEVACELPADLTPQEFDRLIEWLAQAGCDLHEIVEALATTCGDRQPQP